MKTIAIAANLAQALQALASEAQAANHDQLRRYFRNETEAEDVGPLLEHLVFDCSAVSALLHLEGLSQPTLTGENSLLSRCHAFLAD